jgi:DNA (cytosine-5)-methyltransferase 1
MLHISLFSGIGGFELAAEWMGWQNIVSCEINPFGRKVLEYYFPNAYHHDDIKTLNYDTINNELTKRFGAEWRNDDIILTGGFPCQPYSLAGKRKGKDDERHLFPEMLRIIREVKPSWIVGENVLGIVNWNGGLVFHEVQTDLEAEGYEVQPYVLPAAGVGSCPHRRDRVWFVAKNTKCNGFVLGEPNQEGAEIRQFGNTCTGSSIGVYLSEGAITYPNGNGGWDNFPTQSPICTGNDEFSSRLDGITFSKWRNESIKAAGNAVVPQVVYQIFKAIEAYMSKTSKRTF